MLKGKRKGFVANVSLRGKYFGKWVTLNLVQIELHFGL